jgi:hypothetical protein
MYIVFVEGLDTHPWSTVEQVSPKSQAMDSVGKRQGKCCVGLVERLQILQVKSASPSRKASGGR